MPASAGVLAPDSKSRRPLFKDRLNLVPLPYRGVSVQAYDGPMTEHGIASHFLGRETYRRTEFIVLKAPDGGHTVIAVDALDREPLFAPIVYVEVLALPDTCSYVRDPQTDCANRSALAALATQHGIGKDQTLICEGKYDHVNFIHHPSPFVLKVVEVAPPEPPKLYYLDERPAERHDWTLIGCERSVQFHRHYYGDEPRRVEICPRLIAGGRKEPTILKCCLWEFDIEREGEVMVVPWGANLSMIERALRELSHDIDRV